MATTILIVEDDPHVVTLLTELLGQEGYTVEVATDGLVGLLKLRTAAVDAVLLDVMMPDVDGTRMLRQLLEEHEGHLPVPVVVVTGSPDGARTCRELLGEDRVVEKPFDPAVLLDRLRGVLAAEEAS
ncbi:response regulator transcription factor [Nitriliruptor alkaliphilus]|uniref:response regulator transcription factor n=1 Tax=Nitriliruptor alkaliphilus TaxID=427918 RepID=UPI000698E0B0|nr:response regulator [Nitriliruptor alkaliphilus]